MDHQMDHKMDPFEKRPRCTFTFMFSRVQKPKIVVRSPGKASKIGQKPPEVVNFDYTQLRLRPFQKATSTPSLSNPVQVQSLPMGSQVPIIIIEKKNPRKPLNQLKLGKKKKKDTSDRQNSRKPKFQILPTVDDTSDRQTMILLTVEDTSVRSRKKNLLCRCGFEKWTLRDVKFIY